jgi:hypothetical protein
MVRVGGGWMELSRWVRGLTGLTGRFLLDHFADALGSTPMIEEGAQAQASAPTTPYRNSVGRNEVSPAKPGEPVLSASTADHIAPEPSPTPPVPNPSIDDSPSIPPSTSPSTPARTFGLPRTSTDHSLAQFVPRSTSTSGPPPSRSTGFFSPLQSPITPKHKQKSPGPTGAETSPLVPLHFLKKASESPPVREKEKQRIGLGRRSILGKEGTNG